ncbi:AMP-binding protein [Herbidospora daliensis]|uniref:AMP-binding protein n=1 Tax=Herbidospora daliensis TaxID=295585 RepID=UPI0007838725|nr:AMP-binding protein [Herbidospora daliensis]
MTATLPHLLRARAVEQPDRTALISTDGRELTFGEWDAKAGSGACALLGKGLQRGDRVGLLFDNDRWVDFAITCMAVLRAGGVAVPLSARQSAAALKVMTDDCGARWVLTEAPSGAGVPDVDLSPQDPAQILYTSGTTGQPKGVMATHANLAWGHAERPPFRAFGHSAHFLHAFPIGTNAGQMMLVNTLTAHPTAVAAARFDAAEFCGLIEKFRAGTVFVVPAMATELLDSGAWRAHDLSSVILLSSSADALPPRVAAGLPDVFPRATIVNYYTSTEAVPAQTTMIVDPRRPDSVGRATSRGDLMIADEEGTPVSPGEVGEVWLRAPASAQRTYYGDPGTSAKTFRDGWTRMGDLGRLDGDGYLYLVGRESDVVKSGGLKISLPQVETAIREHPWVADAAVIGLPHATMGQMIAAAVVRKQAQTEKPCARDTAGETLKPADHTVPESSVDTASASSTFTDTAAETSASGDTALETPGSGDDAPKGWILGDAALEASKSGGHVSEEPVSGGDVLTADRLRAFLHQRLARNEVPSRYVFVDALPRNELGKVVKAEVRALFAAAKPAGRPLESAEERALARLWTGVLGVPITSADDDFFALGGDSLRAAQLAARVAEKFGVPVEGTFAFDRPSLGRQAAQIRDAVATVSNGGDVVLEDGALSGVQAHWWRWMHASGERRHMPPVHVAVRVPDGLDLGVLRRAVAELVRRHDSLRTVFRHPGVGVVASVEVPIGVHQRENEEEAALLAAERVRAPFDVEGGPLLRVEVIELPTGCVLVVSVHHLVFDGGSATVLLRELGVLYSAFRHGAPSPLPPAVSYGDVVAWERLEWTRHRPWWEAVLDDAPASLERLPGRARDVRRYLADAHRFPVPDVRELARSRGATVSMTLAAAWALTLGAWARAPELVLATPVSGRSKPGFENAVGCLFRWNLITVPGTGALPDVVDHVRRESLAASERQFHDWGHLHAAVPFPAYFRFESWGHPAHLPGVPSEEFDVPAGPIMEWTLPDDDPDLHPPEILISESHDGTLRGQLIYNRHAYEAAAIADLAADFVRRVT